MPPSTLCIVELALATQCFAQTFEYKSKLLFLITNKNQRLYLARKSILAFSLLGEAWALDLLACNSNGRGATKGPGCAGKIMCRAGITTPARVRTRDSPQHIFGETFSVYSVFYLLRELCIPLIKLNFTFLFSMVQLPWLSSTHGTDTLLGCHFDLSLARFFVLVLTTLIL